MKYFNIPKKDVIIWEEMRIIMDVIIGSHVGFKKEKQLIGCVEEALSYGGNTFMFYTGAPQNTNRAIIDPEKTEKAIALMKENGIHIQNVVVHAPYIINLANPKNYDFNVRFLKEEMKRVESLGVKKLVLHPGSSLTLPVEEGLQNIIHALNEVLKDQSSVIICLETMAGKGSERACTLEEVKTIIDGVLYKENIGVCLDTCHLNDAGYDLTEFDSFLERLDELIGMDQIQCIHINDSKNERGIHKDRHENIGFGTIGFDTLISIIYHEKLKGIPKILETPYVSKNDGDKEKVYPPYKFEIEMIRNKKMNQNLIEDIRKYYTSSDK